MKNTLLFFAFLLGISRISIAQNDYRDPSDDPKPDFSFFATIGSRPFHLDTSNLYFSYVDQSPSQDHMESTTKLKETNHAVGVKLGFQNMLANGVTIKAMADFYGGQVSGASFDFGAGYTIGRKRFHIRPTAMFSIGGYGLSLGHLMQNDTYIQVKSSKFYSERVYVKLRAKQFAFSPQVEFGFEFTNKIELILCGGYNLGASSKPFLKFSGQDENEEYISEKEPIDIPNATLLYKDQKLTKTPVGMSGIFIHAGFAFRFPN